MCNHGFIWTEMILNFGVKDLKLYYRCGSLDGSITLWVCLQEITEEQWSEFENLLLWFVPYKCVTMWWLAHISTNYHTLLLGFSHKKELSLILLPLVLEAENPHVSVLMLQTSFKIFLFVLLYNKIFFILKAPTIYCFPVKKKAVKFRNQKCEQMILQNGSVLYAPPLHIFIFIF